MDQSSIRIGSDQYAKSGKSFGLTTLLDSDVGIDGSRIRFQFKGKSEVDHDFSLNNSKIAGFIKKSRAIPGDRLFQYVDESGVAHPLRSSDLNQYLRSIGEGEFSAKDFRTWNGTTAAAAELIRRGPAESETEIKKNLKAAVLAASERLRNTENVARKAYIHPGLFLAYEQGEPFVEALEASKKSALQNRQLEEERFILTLFGE